MTEATIRSFVLTLYVRDKQGKTLSTFEQKVRIKRNGIGCLICFDDCGVVVYEDDAFTQSPVTEVWFLLDADGRNYGTAPNSVYVKITDVMLLLLNHV